MKTDFNEVKPLASLDKQGSMVLPSFAGEYRPMLYQIASSFGFNEKDCNALVEETCLHPGKEGSFIHGDRLALAKRLVRQCVYLISLGICNQRTQDTSLTMADDILNRKLHSLTLKLPLSYRAVYILFQFAHFKEQEIAYILNISVFQVRNRLTTARNKYETRGKYEI
jgi:hypothetical protein